jgi:tetratricopeptide (TPR) repeat protein
LAQDSRDSHLATELALTKNNLGLLLLGVGRVDEATALFQEARSQLTRLAEDDASNLAAVRGVSATLSNLSSLSFDSHPERSVPLLRQAIKQQLTMVGKNRNRLKASAEIAKLYNSLGAALSRTGELSQSEQALSDAIGLQRQLVSISPHVNGYQRDLALSLNNLATVQQQRSDHAGAVRSLREATERYKDTIDADSAEPAALIRMAAMDHNLAVSLIALGQSDQAEMCLTRSIENLRSRIAGSPDPAAEQTQLLRSYSTLLRCQIREDRWEHARITAREYRTELGDVPTLRTRVTEDLTRYQNLADHQTRRRRSQP